jgi:AcrR family transcriptional regulator
MTVSTPASPAGPAVPPELVDAAVSAARRRGVGVAELPVGAIATAAGMSRSTLLRRLGGTRAPLDEAVRAAGVDPGGRPPVRDRAVEAAARLIGERGLGAVTLDAVATAAGCSLPSLHAAFEGRDGLLTAVFERYSPVLDLEALAADPPARIEDTVRAVYRALLAAFGRQPRILPALVADMLSRPDGPAARLLAANFPRMLGSVDALLSAEVRAGRLRPLPYPLLAQLLVGPLALHMITRPIVAAVPAGRPAPPVAETCELLADAFLRAVAAPGPDV